MKKGTQKQEERGVFRSPLNHAVGSPAMPRSALSTREKRALAARALRYSVVVWYSDEDRRYIGRCMEIPGCTIESATETRARRCVRRAIYDWLVHAGELKVEAPGPGAGALWFRRQIVAVFARLRRTRAKQEAERGCGVTEG